MARAHAAAGAQLRGAARAHARAVRLPPAGEPRRGRPMTLRLEVQFEDLQKQRYASHFGMWLFLTSEILLFAGLFALYVAYRTEYAADFAAGVREGKLVI